MLCVSCRVGRFFIKKIGEAKASAFFFSVPFLIAGQFTGANYFRQLFEMLDNWWILSVFAAVYVAYNLLKRYSISCGKLQGSLQYPAAFFIIILFIAIGTFACNFHFIYKAIVEFKGNSVCFLEASRFFVMVILIFIISLGMWMSATCCVGLAILVYEVPQKEPVMIRMRLAFNIFKDEFERAVAGAE
jgi:hypothetical protein